MCGIAGISGLKANSSSLSKMIESLKRRGPDDFGYWNNDSETYLGQTRLSIIDLSVSGHQPMFSHNKNLVIVFNGEIYNYKELKIELIKRGAFFTTETDTEVLLWSYEIFGVSCFSMLRGMFAFAIWEVKSKKLIIARDRFGIKPLLWSFQNNTLVFASTVNTILNSGLIEKYIDENSFFDYMTTGSVLQPKTIIKDINHLEPGKYLLFQNNEIKLSTYWDLSSEISLKHDFEKINFNELVKLTRNTLEDACKHHLIADVHIGSFLSGGVDSTVLTALLSKYANYRIKSYSIGFENNSQLTNELREARLASNFIGTDHTEIVLNTSDIESRFDDFISVIDQPSIDGLNSYWVSYIAKQDVKVAITGLGGDELFAGYPHFTWPSQFSRKPNLIDNLSSTLYSIFPNRIFFSNHLHLLSEKERLNLLRRQFSDTTIKSILSNQLSTSFSSGHFIRYLDSLNSVSAKSIHDISIYELRNYLLNTLLRDVDAVSMGNGLEVRPIFLDNNIVDLALSLPDSCKYNNGILKYILKESTKDLLPPGFLNQKKKGFTLPINKWLHGKLKDRLLTHLNSNEIKQYFDDDFISHLKRFINNESYGVKLYMILVFMDWLTFTKVKFK